MGKKTKSFGNHFSYKGILGIPLFLGVSEKHLGKAFLQICQCRHTVAQLLFQCPVVVTGHDSKISLRSWDWWFLSLTPAQKKERLLCFPFSLSQLSWRSGERIKSQWNRTEQCCPHLKLHHFESHTLNYLLWNIPTKILELRRKMAYGMTCLPWLLPTRISKNTVQYLFRKMAHVWSHPSPCLKTY